MSRIFTKRNRYGFTLVELLIVVGIAGVLSIIGIPQFRRMLMKARKAEAKQALGALYAANSAFFSEYNTHGSNLVAIGFEMDGAVQGRRYTIGFPDAACAPTAIMPLVTNAPFGVNLNNVYPAYYAGAAGGVIQANAADAMTKCAPATRTDDGQTYAATATGYIRPFGVAAGQSATFAGAAAADMDFFTINEKRDLKNTQEGVQ